MARECDGPDWEAVKRGCPLKCRLRNGTSPADRASAPDQVDWAGLPVNLDLVFSRTQRDKVYVQHLMRKRETRLWRQGGQVCVCELTADQGRISDAADSMSGR